LKNIYLVSYSADVTNVTRAGVQLDRRENFEGLKILKLG